jgi:hypothetical protein
VALADVDFGFVDRAVARRVVGRDGQPSQNGIKLQEAYKKAKCYTDFCKMLEAQKGIDGVVVATLDHRHAVIAKAAMELGKGINILGSPVLHESLHGLPERPSSPLLSASAFQLFYETIEWVSQISCCPFIPEPRTIKVQSASSEPPNLSKTSCSSPNSICALSALSYWPMAESNAGNFPKESFLTSFK